MTFAELVAEVQKLKREELRSQAADHLEIVVATEHLEPLTRVLVSFFGPALKPQGTEPSREANRQAAAHGGIRKDQTMYFRQEGEISQCALLWPWGSGKRITVKILQVAIVEPQGGWRRVLTDLLNPHKGTEI
jgi:hypothetical protein